MSALSLEPGPCGNWRLNAAFWGLGIALLAGTASCADDTGTDVRPDASADALLRSPDDVRRDIAISFGADVNADTALTPEAGPLIDGGELDLPPQLTIVKDDPADLPLPGLSADESDTFKEGDALFDTTFRLPDGLGPLFIRTACSACHVEAGKGPGSVTKIQIVDAVTRLPVQNPNELPYGGTERPYAVAGATTPLLAPENVAAGHELLVSRRIGPTVMGRGYIEAIADSEIERVAEAQALRSDGIKGHINRVTYRSQANAAVPISYKFGQAGLIGRFGLKARVATLDDFTADAFQGDMGMTSPLRPDELPNPEGIKDDRKPGVDLDVEDVVTVAAYLRTVAIPDRDNAQAKGPGPGLFEKILCATCHVPSLKTRADFPLKLLAGIDAPVYSDLLLHDMGDDLADGQTDESAGPRDWKTAPLVGLRYQRSFLHDGRARTISEAILKHAGNGSQANGSVGAFKNLGDTEKAALVAFVLSL